MVSIGPFGRLDGSHEYEQDIQCVAELFNHADVICGSFIEVCSPDSTMWRSFFVSHVFVVLSLIIVVDAFDL